MTDPLTTIADAADALTDPRQHREPRWEWDQNRNRKPLPDHVTTLPGLIQQLRDMTEPGATDDGAGVRTVPDSRPPVAIDAVSLLASIEFGVARRCLEFGWAARETVEATIRLLVGEAGRLPSDKQRVVAAELRSWRHQAEVICRWQVGGVELVAPCPARVGDTTCGARGTLLANADTHAAWCTACGTQWEPDEAEALFRHVREYREASARAAEVARERVRAEKERARAAGVEALARRTGRDAA